MMLKKEREKMAIDLSKHFTDRVKISIDNVFGELLSYKASIVIFEKDCVAEMRLNEPYMGGGDDEYNEGDYDEYLEMVASILHDKLSSQFNFLIRGSKMDEYLG